MSAKHCSVFILHEKLIFSSSFSTFQDCLFPVVLHLIVLNGALMNIFSYLSGQLVLTSRLGVVGGSIGYLKESTENREKMIEERWQYHHVPILWLGCDWLVFLKFFFCISYHNQPVFPIILLSFLHSPSGFRINENDYSLSVAKSTHGYTYISENGMDEHL